MKRSLSILLLFSGILFSVLVFSMPVDEFQNENKILSGNNFQINYTLGSQLFDFEFEDFDFDFFIENNQAEIPAFIPCGYHYFNQDISYNYRRILLPVLLDLPPPFVCS
jgi:hypothetical protein